MLQITILKILISLPKGPGNTFFQPQFHLTQDQQNGKTKER